MKWSIASIINFNMFGIPLVGADICGFNGNTTVELCARWSSLGAFYPFSRNHNTDDGIDQDPVALGVNVTNAAKNALQIRYSLISYLYTLFYRSSVFGDTVARALFFEFPNDETSLSIDTQFMWGSAVMVVPVLEQGAAQVNGYFPPGAKWYDYVTNQLIVGSKGGYVKLDMPIDKIGVALRGGNILATLQPKSTTTETREGNFTLKVALDDNEQAKGELFWDDGDSLYTLFLGRYTLLKFSANKNSVTSTPVETGFENKIYMERVEVLGVQSKPKSVSVNGQAVSQFSFDTGVLSISNLSVDLTSAVNVTWS
jgi:lysosomal alpha-glucosidase